MNLAQKLEENYSLNKSWDTIFNWFTDKQDRIELHIESCGCATCLTEEEANALYKFLKERYE